jgi:hypothetical protein
VRYISKSHATRPSVQPDACASTLPACHCLNQVDHHTNLRS